MTPTQFPYPHIPAFSHSSKISDAGLSGISSANKKTETKNGIITFRLV